MTGLTLSQKTKKKTWTIFNKFHYNIVKVAVDPLGCRLVDPKKNFAMANH